MSSKEIKQDFTARHGAGVTFPDTEVMYYADGSMRQRDGGAAAHAEDLDPLTRARYKVKYWDGLLSIRQQQISVVRQTLLSCASAMEKGHSVDTSHEEAELARLVREIKQASRGRAAALRELDPLLPPRFKRTGNPAAADKASELRALLRRTKV
jgi:hypothetical protein